MRANWCCAGWQGWGGLLTASSLGNDLGLPTCLAALAVTTAVSIRARTNPLVLGREISWATLALVAGLFVMADAMESIGAMQRTKEWFVWAEILGPTAGAFITGSFVGIANNLVANLPLGLCRNTLQAAHAKGLLAEAVLIGVDVRPNLS